MSRLKNAKAKGSRLERRSKADLEARGFLVTKAGGSLGVADLVALHPESGEVRLVQVKANRLPGAAEMGGLKALARRFQAAGFGWRVQVHRYLDRRSMVLLDLTLDGGQEMAAVLDGEGR